MPTCNCSELSILSILLSVRLSSFRLKSSFLKPPAEKHISVCVFLLLSLPYFLYEIQTVKYA
ncbi:unnamed protein product [Hymenolepis diminuta]|uniref:Uncharacterized protein n=1 Tax=Hymenolepis diminuta TaxID=6216 RepID=A0A564YTD5_HYMDI|nr:unnamed protein product [Hymenolepis diminuta]